MTPDTDTDARARARTNTLSRNRPIVKANRSGREIQESASASFTITRLLTLMCWDRAGRHPAAVDEVGVVERRERRVDRRRFGPTRTPASAEGRAGMGQQERTGEACSRASCRPGWRGWRARHGTPAQRQMPVTVADGRHQVYSLVRSRMRPSLRAALCHSPLCVEGSTPRNYQ